MLRKNFDELSQRQQDNVLEKFDGLAAVISCRNSDSPDSILQAYTAKKLRIRSCGVDQTVVASVKSTLASCTSKEKKGVLACYLKAGILHGDRKDICEALSVSQWMYDEAKKLSKKETITTPSLSPLRREKFDIDDFMHFLNWMFQHDFMKSISWGSGRLRYENKQEVMVPHLVQSLVTSHLLTLYNEYCCSVSYKKLSDSTIRRLLKLYPIQRLKVLNGLDPNVAKGLDSFELLHILVTEVGDSEYERQLKITLTAAKDFIKGEFQTMMGDKTPCDLHCREWGLSDKVDPCLTQPCHETHSTCDKCMVITKVRFSKKFQSFIG